MDQSWVLRNEISPPVNKYGVSSLFPICYVGITSIGPINVLHMQRVAIFLWIKI